MNQVTPGRLVLAAIVFSAVEVLGEPAKLLNAGRWEVTLQNELPYATAPVTYTACIEPGAAERPEIPKGKPSDSCKVLSGGVSGNVLSYSVKCGSKKSSDVRITYHGDRYEGVVELSGPEGKLRQVVKAKRIGSCDAPLPEGQE